MGGFNHTGQHNEVQNVKTITGNQLDVNLDNVQVGLFNTIHTVL